MARARAAALAPRDQVDDHEDRQRDAQEPRDSKSGFCFARRHVPMWCRRRAVTNAVRVRSLDHVGRRGERRGRHFVADGVARVTGGRCDRRARAAGELVDRTAVRRADREHRDLRPARRARLRDRRIARARPAACRPRRRRRRSRRTSRACTRLRPACGRRRRGAIAMTNVITSGYARPSSTPARRDRSIGLTRCASKLASSARCRSDSWPYPVIATRRSRSSQSFARSCTASS
jgi:hypothetical protein